MYRIVRSAFGGDGNFYIETPDGEALETMEGDARITTLGNTSIESMLQTQPGTPGNGSGRADGGGHHAHERVAEEEELGRSVACMFPRDSTDEGKALLLAATLMIKSAYFTPELYDDE